MTMPLTPSSGLWKPNHLKALFYGAGSASKNIIPSLPSESSRAFIITTKSLKDSAQLKGLQSNLGSRLAGTFSSIGAHAPVADLDAATEAVREDSSVDTVISIGGGSPIDSAKAISHRLHEKTEKWLYHIAIPTTLSAAECTMMAGYTEKDGVKTGVRGPELPPHVIIYDADFVAGSTPEWLWMSTGLRALDHAVELWYRPDTPAAPARAMLFSAVKDLFTYLPAYKKAPEDKDVITRLQLASFNSLYPFGQGMSGGIGLSHGLGYALGSPYGIPHGITSCLTLGKVVRVRADQPEMAKLLAQLKPSIGKGEPTGDDHADTIQVGDAIEELVEHLGLKTDLNKYKVDKSELETIVARGTGGDKGELAKKVRVLVQSLWSNDSKLGESQL